MFHEIEFLPFFSPVAIRPCQPDLLFRGPTDLESCCQQKLSLILSDTFVFRKHTTSSAFAWPSHHQTGWEGFSAAQGSQV